MVRRIYGQNGMAEVVERDSEHGPVLQVGLRFARSGQPLELMFAGEELQRLFRGGQMAMFGAAPGLPTG